jgi:superfamily I DNA/RNA helicase
MLESNLLQLSEIGSRDHSVTNEYRVFGPPGTGKTTHVARQIGLAATKLGAESVLVTSFSKAAATELAGKSLPISGNNLGTLHSHCYAALGNPEIAECQIEEWNRRNPRLRISSKNRRARIDGEDSGAPEEQERAYAGDDLLRELNRWRGMIAPANSWPRGLREFQAEWDEYKRTNRLLDFTDLIEIAERDIHIAPGAPNVLFVDEAQDLNPMQLKLVRNWGAHADYFVQAADDDQCIYSWTGASPDAVLDPPIPDDHKIFLEQSFRIPRAVHSLASGFIRQVTRREEKQYRPRDTEGTVCRLAVGHWRYADSIVENSVRHVERGQSVMLLASCSYMLRPLIGALRKRGVPFHNPYRKSNGFWNPLGVTRRNSAANRLSALLSAHHSHGGSGRWTVCDLSRWLEWLKPEGTLRAGALEEVKLMPPGAAVTLDTLVQIFEPLALAGLVEAFGADHRRLIEWWRKRLMPSVVSRVRFPADVATYSGVAALKETPRIIVGTIHSAKGGEADVVYLFPDLSRAGCANYERFGPLRDSVLRLFYVGMTRARDTLYICPQEGPLAARL